MASKKVPIAYPYANTSNFSDLLMKYEDLVVILLHLKVIYEDNVEQNKPLLDSFLRQRIGYDVRAS